LGGHAGEVYVYTNSKQAMEMQKSQPGMEQLQALIRKLAPVDYSGVSVKINAKDIGLYSFSPLSTGADTEGVRNLITKSSSSKAIEVVNFAPAETLLVMATSVVDAKIYYEFFEELMGMVGGAAGKKSQVEDSMKMFEMQLGFSIK